jgi:tol-pal system protein YbgF
MSNLHSFLVPLQVIALGYLLTQVINSHAEQSIPVNPIVVESLSEEEKPFRAPIVEDQPISGIENQYQVQILQQELLELRGLVEELDHELQLMKRRQEDRYLELDKRFEDFRKSAGRTTVPAAGGSLSGIETAGTGNESTSSFDNTKRAAQPGGDSEKSLYDTSLELIRNRQYELAIQQLNIVISKYPSGEYAPNAYYWLGEVYAAMPDPDYEMARQSLAQVISFFPEHRKVPDAAFKLGKVYNLMGDCARSRDILTQVIQQHQGKTVAKLAETYLREKVECAGE